MCVYICLKNVKMKQVSEGMVCFRRETNRLAFRQEFKARFIGGDVKALATGVYTRFVISKYVYLSTRHCDFQKMIFQSIEKKINRPILFPLSNFHLRSIVISLEIKIARYLYKHISF